MSSFPRKMSPDVLKMHCLAGRLGVEEQLEFLHLLISSKDMASKKELIDRANRGEKVWKDNPPE